MYTGFILYPCRRLNEIELENILLRDPHSRSTRRSHLNNQSRTIGTSGCFARTATSLLRCIRIINQSDFGETGSDAEPGACLGEGRFGKCYLRSLGHYKVCVKIFKRSDNNGLTHEANIIANFMHPNLPYLFGVCIGSHPAIVTSYHGYNNESLTIHKALFGKIELQIDWINVLIQVVCGIKYLHSRHKVLHNDLKGDNVVLTSRLTSSLGAVVIDFGKACEANKGQRYSLSEKQKEYYKLHHPHIAPDLRDGKCMQSVLSDIYSLGRIINNVNKIVLSNSNKVMNISRDCMQYDSALRPDAIHLHELMTKMSLC